MVNSELVHDEAQGRFVIANDEGESLLEYRLEGDTVNFYRTFVPEPLRSARLAEKLVRAGLKWAKGAGYTIEADCWYVEKFLKK